MPNLRRTAYFCDPDMVRDLLRKEMAVRGTPQVKVAEETGILLTGISRFLNGNQTLHGDALITLIKWMGMDVNRFIKRRGRLSRHTDTYEQTQLRKALAFVESQGVKLQPGESPVDALMALVAKGAPDA
jgi:hypothetical protein